MSEKTALYAFILSILIFITAAFVDFLSESYIKNSPVIADIKADKNKKNYIKSENYIYKTKSKQVVNNFKKELKVNPPTELSYKTKDYIYKERIKYVADSIFANPNYYPSEAVFGQIIDNKPWISLNFCRLPNGEARVDGLSEESRFINNPNILVALEFPYSLTQPDENDLKNCKKPRYQMVPQLVKYDEDKKEITVYYFRLPYLLDNMNSYYSFNGLNARDLGYNYAYVDTDKSTLIMDMRQENNITNEIISFQNFLHLGGSCRVEGGCNNGSPEQPQIDFKFTKAGYEKSPKPPEIYIKLWKNKPLNPKTEPDIVERIKFIRHN